MPSLTRKVEPRKRRGFVDRLMIEFLAKHGLFPGASNLAKGMD